MTMTPILRKRTILSFLTLALALTGLGICAGCANPQVEFGLTGDDYAGNYYEPGGYEYGAWEGGFRVGPGRNGERGFERNERPFRSAGAARRTPSVPSRSREKR